MKRDNAVFVHEVSTQTREERVTTYHKTLSGTRAYVRAELKWAPCYVESIIYKGNNWYALTLVYVA